MKQKLRIIVLIFLCFSWLNTEKVFSAENKSTLPQVQMKNPDFEPYMRGLTRKIKKNWTPPANSTSRHVVLKFQIDKNGNIHSCNVVKSSGSASVDKSAIDAVYASVPFSKFPAEFKGKFIDVQLTFD